METKTANPRTEKLVKHMMKRVDHIFETGRKHGIKPEQLIRASIDIIASPQTDFLPKKVHIFFLESIIKRAVHQVPWDVFETQVRNECETELRTKLSSESPLIQFLIDLFERLEEEDNE